MARTKTGVGLLDRQALEFLRRAVDEGANEAGRGVIRVTVEIGEVDPLSLIDSQPAGEALYWSRRGERREMAGLGVASCIEGVGPIELTDIFRQMNDLLAGTDPQVRFYGGLNFLLGTPGRRPSFWQGLPQYRFVLPRIEVVRTVDRCHLSVNVTGDLDEIGRRDLYDRVEGLVADQQPAHPVMPSVQERIDRPDYEQWREMVKSVLAGINHGQLQKTVLARETELRLGDRLNLARLLFRLRAISRDCFGFGFQFANGDSWVGASPERIFSRYDRSLKVEAVAGTRPRGASSRQDEQLASGLLIDGKERREHELVADHIRTVLARLCRSVTTDNASGGSGPGIIKLDRVQHLYTRFAGQLNDGVTDAELLAELHPTPAVGGTPRPAALAMIRQLEPFDRGWYAGPVGWVGPQAAEFAVAIRSGLLCRDRMRLYSGAGIVDGSAPETEWDEIESKLGSFKAALGEP